MIYYIYRYEILEHVLYITKLYILDNRYIFMEKVVSDQNYWEVMSIILFSSESIIKTLPVM